MKLIVMLVAVLGVMGTIHADDAPVVTDTTTWRDKGWGSRARPDKGIIDRVVIHSTAAAVDVDKKNAIRPREDWFKDDLILNTWQKEGVSVHYYISRAGAIFKLVEEKNVAYHDPKYNARSIGIELAGIHGEKWLQDAAAKFPAEDLKYTNPQYTSLSWLLKDIKSRHADIKVILHSDIYRKNGKDANGADKWVQRKSDPGPGFDTSNLPSEIPRITAHTDAEAPAGP